MSQFGGIGSFSYTNNAKRLYPLNPQSYIVPTYLPVILPSYPHSPSYCLYQLASFLYSRTSLPYLRHHHFAEQFDKPNQEKRKMKA